MRSRHSWTRARKASAIYGIYPPFQCKYSLSSRVNSLRAGL